MSAKEEPLRVGCRIKSAIARWEHRNSFVRPERRHLIDVTTMNEQPSKVQQIPFGLSFTIGFQRLSQEAHLHGVSNVKRLASCPNGLLRAERR
jgi:hypothetical protein